MSAVFIGGTPRGVLGRETRRRSSVGVTTFCDVQVSIQVSSRTILTVGSNMAREEFDAFAVGASTRLFRVARLMGADHHLAEDLVQDVLTRVYLAWPRIHGDPYGFAYRVLVNVFANHRRWRRRHPEDPIPELADRRSSSGRIPEIVERDAILSALRELPLRQRTTIVLRYYADLTEAQTAAAMGVSVGTVKSQHARAMERLRAVLGGDLGSPTFDARSEPDSGLSVGKKENS